MSVFVKENEFEQALCEHLIQHGWSSDVIMITVTRRCWEIIR